MTTRILLVDDQTILRRGLRSLFAVHSRFEIVGEAEDGLVAVDLAQKLKPDVVIMDITLPHLNGIEATRRIVKMSAGIRVVVLSVHSDRRFVEKAIAAGALGYLRKDCEFDELLASITIAMQGHLYISPAFGDGNTEIQWRIVNEPPVELTAKEKDILRGIAQGFTTKEISDQIHLGVKSVERYRQIIMEKLDLHTIAELTRYAIAEGLLPAE